MQYSTSDHLMSIRCNWDTKHNGWLSSFMFQPVEGWQLRDITWVLWLRETYCYAQHTVCPQCTLFEDVSFTDSMENAKSTTCSSRFQTSATMGFQHTEHCTTQYVPNLVNVIDYSPEPFWDKVINWVRNMEEAQLEMINANLWESLKQAEKFAKICDLSKTWQLQARNWRLLSPSKMLWARS